MHTTTINSHTGWNCVTGVTFFSYITKPPME